MGKKQHTLSKIGNSTWKKNGRHLNWKNTERLVCSEKNRRIPIRVHRNPTCLEEKSCSSFVSLLKE